MKDMNPRFQEAHGALHSRNKTIATSRRTASCERGRENHGEYLQNRWRKEGLPTKWHLYWQQTCQHNGSGQERTESGVQSAERK